MAGIIVKSVGSESVAPVGQGDRVVVPEFFDGEFADLSVLINLFSGPTAGALYAPWVRSSLYEDSAGTTLASVDGPVGRMEDLSGNGNHATQATADARPVLRYSGGLYYLEGDGVDDFMVIGGSGLAIFRNRAYGSLLTAGRDRTPAAGDAFHGFAAWGQGTGPETRIGDRTRHRSSAEIGASARRLDGESITLATVANSDAEKHVLTALAKWAEGSLVSRVDGSSSATASFPSSGNTSDTDSAEASLLSINTSLYYSPSDLYGVVAIARDLTASELASAERALANRSGVVLA